ncbi:hypothetical protein PIB30_053777 [Stylosanthes scabra]|uniref:Uncharacterized protein n=1 Tax=Stylosanthes scabra TaxID=79078 RepID=A0ABU6VLP6_9FABA|nr:hypothetical protein [Stylosanthes scabra]
MLNPFDQELVVTMKKWGNQRCQHYPFSTNWEIWGLYEEIHGTGDMQHFSKSFQAYVNDPTHGVVDPQILNLAFGPLREYTSCTMMKVNRMKFQTHSNARGRILDNMGVYLKGDAGQGECDWYGMLNEILELKYSGEPKNRVVLFRCVMLNMTHSYWLRMRAKCIICNIPVREDRNGGSQLNANQGGKIESQDEVVPDETYQNLEEIPVRLINETEIPVSLSSPAGEVDIVNVPVNEQNNPESEEETADEDGTNEPGSDSAELHSSQEDDEH